MRHSTTFLFLPLASAFVVSCEGPRAARPRADSPEVIERARIRVLDQLPTLDSASREMIRTNAPKIWFSGVPFGGDYLFEWTISSNRVASLDAFNTFDHLESAPVKIRQPVQDSHK